MFLEITGMLSCSASAVSSTDRDGGIIRILSRAGQRVQDADGAVAADAEDVVDALVDQEIRDQLAALRSRHGRVYPEDPR